MSFQKVAILENEIEALRLASELTMRGIPHALRSYHDTAYDGLFQFSAGWGHVEAPREYQEGILAVLTLIRKESGEAEQKGQETEERPE